MTLQIDMSYGIRPAIGSGRNKFYGFDSYMGSVWKGQNGSKSINECFYLVSIAIESAPSHCEPKSI